MYLCDGCQYHPGEAVSHPALPLCKAAHHISAAQATLKKSHQRILLFTVVQINKGNSLQLKCKHTYLHDV